MKKLVAAVAAVFAIVLGSAGIASASPPGGDDVTVGDSTVTAGAPVDVSADCTVGETVTFTLDGSSDTSVCVASTDAEDTSGEGTSGVSLTAPTAPGTYTGTVSGSVSGDLGTFTVVVEGATGSGEGTTGGSGGGGTATPSGQLPATGSDSSGAITTIAIGLLVAGLGLFAVATIRRRQPIAS